jgi:hypothetical protein
MGKTRRNGGQFEIKLNLNYNKKILLEKAGFFLFIRNETSIS